LSRVASWFRATKWVLTPHPHGGEKY